MQRAFEECERRLRGLDPSGLLRVWEARAKRDSTWLQESAFHLAAAERLKQIAHMGIDLDEEERRRLCRRADAILERLRRVSKGDPGKLEAMEEIVRRSDAYHRTYGAKSARHYMYEQGVIDALGDRLLR